MLYVKSDPPGAAILIDGQIRGKTPALLRDLPSGELTLKLALPGAPLLERTVHVEAGKVARLDLKIAIPKAALTVVSDPFEAEVHIDRRKRGNSPVTVEGLVAGEHEVILYLEGYERVARTVTLQAGESKVLEIKLKERGPAVRGAEPGPNDGMGPVGVPGPHRSSEGLPKAMAPFMKLIIDGDYAAAVRYALEEAERPQQASIADHLREAAKVAQALEKRSQLIRDTVAKMVGQEVVFATRSGVRKGRVTDVGDEGVSLSAKIAVRGRVVGATAFTVAWKQLAYGQEEELAKGWDASRHGKVAQAILALGRRDLAAADAELLAVQEHKLKPFLVQTVSGLRTAGDADKPAANDEASMELVNLARDATISVSNQDPRNGKIAAVNDGDYSTTYRVAYWLATEGTPKPHWMTIKLAKPAILRRIKMLVPREGKYKYGHVPLDYTIHLHRSKRPPVSCLTVSRGMHPKTEANPQDPQTEFVIIDLNYRDPVVAVTFQCQRTSGRNLAPVVYEFEVWGLRPVNRP